MTAWVGRPAPARLVVGPLAVDRLTLLEAVDRIEAMVAAGRGGAVYTPNVDHVVMAERDAAFRSAYAQAELCLADGMPLVWASRLLGAALPERVAGADLVLPLLERAAARGWRVYLMGGGAGVADEAAARLRERFPALCIAGTDAPRVEADGTLGAGNRSAVLERIRQARAQLLLVALGAPKQELWIGRYREALQPTVSVGLGASLDFLAGRVRRAPRWISRAGLEWLWRLSREPRRLWRRYLVNDPRFAVIVARALRERGRHAAR